MPYVLQFDPAALPARAALRAQLGYAPHTPLLVAQSAVPASAPTCWR